MAYIVCWRNNREIGYFASVTNNWEKIKARLAEEDGEAPAIVTSVCHVTFDCEAKDTTTRSSTQLESAEFRVTNTTTGAVHRFDYRSEAESFYDAAVAEYGPLHGYELTVLIRRHTPPEMLGAGG